MLTDKKRAALLKDMEGSTLSEEEKEGTLNVYELLEPSLKVRKDGRILLGLGHCDKTPLGLYRTLKRFICPDTKEKELKEGIRKIELVLLSSPQVSKHEMLTLIHELQRNMEK